MALARFTGMGRTFRGATPLNAIAAAVLSTGTLSTRRRLGSTASTRNRHSQYAFDANYNKKPLRR